MNFLAHLHLADISNTSLAGNLAGDFCRGNIADHPLHLRQGIWLHRKIDTLTDNDESVKALKAQFPAPLRRVAPILIDLAFDHMLARYWDEYHHQPLLQFSQRCYQHLADTAELPTALATLLPKMRQGDWLSNYADKQGFQLAVSGVSKRLSKPELFNGATKALNKLDVDVEIAFRTFYPQLMAYSRRWSRDTPAEYLG
ncbi:ACP phosphodiesterase [Shewanella mangrovi]|uniref:ACP phosphodiesterase n=1 Tax=Shewanella mangrovi TaxID=1515746 RepID=A0A094LPS0_9GAMM|nr:ACP phosphodiesterase [Shewanella mangrovi]KFZ37153.1 ACP phosphodiesterase [Shewanella mangrovi]